MNKYSRNYYKNNIECLKSKFSEFIKGDDIDIYKGNLYKNNNKLSLN